MSRWVPLFVTVLAACGAGEVHESALQAPAGSAPQAPAKPVAEKPGPSATGPYAELVRAYALADVEYGKQLQAARQSGKDGNELRHPARDFYPRFEALVTAGDGHALLWLASRTASAHPERTKEENRAAAWSLYERIVREHAQAPWLREFAKTTSALYVEYGATAVDVLVDQLIASAQDREVVAELLYRSAGEARRAKHDERALALSTRLQKEFADTEYGKRAAEAALVAQSGAKGVGLNRGQLAPDFTTTDVSGVEFKLSDYRGKVVIVDFWGFW